MYAITPIRLKYPHPVNASVPRVTDPQPAYCVGGALCLYFGHSREPFPQMCELASHLLKINPNLTVRRAENCALHIIASNDDSRFQRAWVFAQAALYYGYTGVHYAQN
jgi:hypothetical protein